MGEKIEKSHNAMLFILICVIFYLREIDREKFRRVPLAVSDFSKEFSLTCYDDVRKTYHIFCNFAIKIARLFHV